MNEKEEKFLGGYGAIHVASREEFEKVREWLGIHNLFLANGEPANKLNYDEGKEVLFKNDFGQIEYTSLDAKPGHISDENVIRAGDIVTDEMTVHDEIDTSEAVEFKVESIRPAVIDSNIKQFKKVIIPRVEKYKNIIVTKENYKEAKQILTMINKSSKEINDYKIKVKKQATSTVTDFENDVKEIIAVYNEVVGPIKDSIKAFEEEEKQAKKEAYMSEIQKMLTIAVNQEFLSEKYANKFEFNDNWLKSSYSRKRVLEEASEAINVLMHMEEQEKQVRETNIRAFEETINNAMRLINATTPPNIQKYIDLYDNGMSAPFIIGQINKDIEDLANAEKAAKEDARKESSVTDTNTMKTDEHVHTAPVYGGSNTVENVSKTPVADEQTGEVFGYFDEQKIVMKIQENKAPGRIFKYTYVFEGDAGVLKTLNMFMKILTKLNKTFKFERK